MTKDAIIDAGTTCGKGAATVKDAAILSIAKRHFFVETLETQGSDQLDFRDVGVAGMKAALEEAFLYGMEAGLSGNLSGVWPVTHSEKE